MRAPCLLIHMLVYLSFEQFDDYDMTEEIQETQDTPETHEFVVFFYFRLQLNPSTLVSALQPHVHLNINHINLNSEMRVSVRL